MICDVHPQHVALYRFVFVLKIALSSRQSLCLKHIIFTQCSGHLLIMAVLRTTFTSANDGFIPQTTGPVSFHSDLSLVTSAHRQSGGLARSFPSTDEEPNENQNFDLRSMAPIDDIFGPSQMSVARVEGLNKVMMCTCDGQPLHSWIRKKHM